jgi:hypothetical protein
LRLGTADHRTHSRHPEAPPRAGEGAPAGDLPSVRRTVHWAAQPKILRRAFAADSDDGERMRPIMTMNDVICILVIFGFVILFLQALWER